MPIPDDTDASALLMHVDVRYVNLIESKLTKMDPLGISATRSDRRCQIATLIAQYRSCATQRVTIYDDLPMEHSRTTFRARNSRSDGNTRGKYAERDAHDLENHRGTRIMGCNSKNIVGEITILESSIEKYRKVSKYRNNRDFFSRDICCVWRATEGVVASSKRTASEGI